jgi:16S rRNA (guanine966-N2)-methyltransferase
VEVRETDALRWLETQPVEPFDLVLLDPPYDLDLLAPACTMLARRGWLAPRALVYLETASRAAPPELPPGWAPVREGSAGAVRFALVRVETALPGGT